MITKFKNLKHYGSSGIVFWYENKVLLVHPYDPDGDRYDGWSYPKGRQDAGETKRETAIREVNEEININLPINFLDKTRMQELKPVIKKKGIKHYWYFTYKLTQEEFSKYFNDSFVIPKEKLQLDEVDEARFMDIDEAKTLISNSFKDILK